MKPEDEEEPIKKVVSNGYLLIKEKKAVIRYNECRRNHAANIGKYAVDGCREFMAAGEEGAPSALTCAACSCHRNFHRRSHEINHIIINVCYSSCDHHSSISMPPN